MKTFNFTAWYGDEKKVVEIDQVTLGPQGFHIYIDRFYFGMITLNHDEWVYLSPNPYFQSDDIQVLIEIIKKEFAEPAP